MPKSDRTADSDLTAAQVAEWTGKPKQTVSDWMRAGLKSRRIGRHRVVKVRDLVKFLAARDYQPGSQRERLAKEQADKIALENALKRGETIYSGHVAEVISTLAADLAARHDGVAGRVASEFAGTNDPAVIRGRLLDELRGVRGAFADATDKLADALGTAPDDGGDYEAAAEEEREPVGRRKPRAAARKRRTRAVAKR